MVIFHVITDYGSTFVSGNARAHVWHEDHYNKIDAKYLNEGQRVRFERKYIPKSLDEIDAILAARSGRYRDAKALLFERNENNIYIPRLRCEIIRGVETPTQDLETRILRSNGADLNPADYRLITDLVHDVLVRFAASRGMKAPVWETALSWIKGDVVSPANPLLYAALADIHPYFMDPYHDFQQGGRFKDAYDHYMKIRRCLMAWRAPADETAPQEPTQSWSAKRSGTLEEERLIIMEEFGTDINSRFVDAVVLKVERVRKKREHGVLRRQSKEPHLFKGVYTGDNVPEGTRVVSIDQIDLRGEIGDINPLEEPLVYTQKLKEICIRYGFPLNMMRDRFLGVGRDKAEMMQQVQQEVKNIFERYSPDSIRRELLQHIEKIGGFKYENLDAGRRAEVDAIISQQTLTVFEAVQQRLVEDREKLDTLTTIVKKELE